MGVTPMARVNKVDNERDWYLHEFSFVSSDQGSFHSVLYTRGCRLYVVVVVDTNNQKDVFCQVQLRRKCSQL